MIVITPMGYANCYRKKRGFWRAPVMLKDDEDPITYIEDWWNTKGPYKSDFYEIYNPISRKERLDAVQKLRTESEEVIQIIHCRYIYFIISKVVNK